MPAETSSPFAEKPSSRRSINWPEVVKVSLTLLAVLGAIGMVYLRGEFATHESVKSAVEPLALKSTVEPLMPLPAKVQSLEEFRTRQEKAQDKTDARLEAINATQAATNEILKQLAAQQGRTLDQLDRIERRAGSARP